MKRYLLISAALLTVLTVPVFAQTKPISAFVGGINHREAKQCIQAIDKSKCKLKDRFPDYKICVRKVLVSNPECRQSLAFFELTGGGIFKEIRRYHQLDVILADYVYIADQGTGYFLVMPNGQFIALPLIISKKALKKASGYQKIANRYPHVGVWQILNFPVAMKLPNNQYRLVFTQQLKDGCNACALAGTAKVAYDFSADGKQFYGVKVLKLIP